MTDVVNTQYGELKYLEGYYQGKKEGVSEGFKMHEGFGTIGLSMGIGVFIGYFIGCLLYSPAKKPSK